MSLLTKPTPAQITKFLDVQSNKSCSYPKLGATRQQPPRGFNVDRNRVLLGCGEQIYQAGCEALRGWKMFPTRWTEISPKDAELQEGTIVGMLAHCFGTWWMNACRIVYTFDESGRTHRFGFAYGTLPGHVESGEERFTIEWDENDCVWYEIYSFSRPRHWLVRLASPLARRLQKRFVRESMAQMRQIVASSVDVLVDEGSQDSYPGVFVG